MSLVTSGSARSFRASPVPPSESTCTTPTFGEIARTRKKATLAKRYVFIGVTYRTRCPALYARESSPGRRSSEASVCGRRDSSVKTSAKKSSS
jgi:hypothetical protein